MLQGRRGGEAAAVVTTDSDLKRKKMFQVYSYGRRAAAMASWLAVE